MHYHSFNSLQVGQVLFTLQIHSPSPQQFQFLIGRLGTFKECYYLMQEKGSFNSLQVGQVHCSFTLGSQSVQVSIPYRQARYDNRLSFFFSFSSCFNSLQVGQVRLYVTYRLSQFIVSIPYRQARYYLAQAEGQQGKKVSIPYRQARYTARNQM